MHAEVEAAREAGLAASFVTETGLPFPIAGAVRVEDQAQFHPRKYLLALAEDFTASRRPDLRAHPRRSSLDEGEPCRVTTERGATVTARDVVVATHYPVFDRALLFARLEPRRELVVAAVIPADRDPGGMYITPEQNTRSVRTAPYRDGQRLLIVTGEHFTPGAGEVTERVAAASRLDARAVPRRRGRLPVGGAGQHPTDHVPFVGPFHPGGHARLRGHRVRRLGHEHRRHGRPAARRADHR